MTNLQKSEGIYDNKKKIINHDKLIPCPFLLIYKRTGNGQKEQIHSFIKMNEKKWKQDIFGIMHTIEYNVCKHLIVKGNLFLN
jgi:hypothetical protein